MTAADKSSDYPSRIAEIHRALGIPSDYAATRRMPLIVEAAADSLVEPDVPIGLGSRKDGIQTSPKGTSGSTLLVRPAPVLLLAATAQAWSQLVTRAATEGIVLLPLSGFRSVERQAEIFRRKLLAGKSMDEILRVNAAPGHSEHHSGRAIDIGAPGSPPLEEEFERTSAFRWLQINAREFRFRLSYARGNPHGIGYEPWHWCHG